MSDKPQIWPDDYVGQYGNHCPKKFFVAIAIEPLIFSHNYTKGLLSVDIHISIISIIEVLYISMVEILPRDKAENEKLTAVVN